MFLSGLSKYLKTFFNDIGFQNVLFCFNEYYELDLVLVDVYLDIRTYENYFNL
jgi:hypothetical protein